MENVLVCNKTLEAQFKILHRVHCTPYILNKIDPLKSSVCPKCKTEVGTYSHMFWSCPIIASFWNRIKLKLERIFSCTIESEPWFFILGMVKDEVKLTSCQIQLTYKLLFIACKCILIRWLEDRPHKINLWHNEIMKILPFERLYARIKGNDTAFERTWSPFLSTSYM